MNQNLESTLTEFWNGCEGQAAGVYLLGKKLAEDEEGATFGTGYGDPPQAAAIKLIPCGDDSEARLAVWREVAELSHPHLVRLFDCGPCTIDARPMIYAVMERPEGNLANVLPERKLSTTEAREMLEAWASALAYLHERGFAHGGVAPAAVVAVGDVVKLASDGIRRVDAAGNGPEEDLRGLRSTLVAALPEDLPQPFLEVVGNPQWTASRIVERLKEGDRIAVMRPPAAEQAPRSRALFYTLGAAAVFLVAILWLLGRNRSEAPVAKVVVVESPSAPAAVATSPVAAPVVRTEPAPVAADAGSGKFFVIAATYRQRKDAEKKAERMGKRWPQFRPQVYSPADGRYHFVVLGMNLSEKSAAALRVKARRAGVSRDVYVTK